MRRFVAITLLAIFGLPFASSLFALTPKSDANLPACCRRNGKHHCMMAMAEHTKLASDKPEFGAPPEKCPYSPTALLGTTHPNAFSLPNGQMIYAELVSHSCGTAQTESKLRIARDRARGKRGPPASSIL